MEKSGSLNKKRKKKQLLMKIKKKIKKIIFQKNH
jgi:hypothetical protein